MKQDCLYQGEALNVLTAFQGLWSSSNMENLNVTKIFFFLKSLRFYVKTFPTRHVKYKVINFAPVNKSIMAYNLP